MTINHMNYLFTRRCPGNKVPAGKLAFAGARVPVVLDPLSSRGEEGVKLVAVPWRGDGAGERDGLTLKQKGGYYGD